MCSIAMLYHANCSQEEREAEIEKMNELSQHRGPDNSAIWLDDHVALGHNRLSIIDPSEKGKQPMQHNHLHLVFNGCIYNYVELRDDLIANGYAFNSESDSEVILAAYELWGEDCFDRFNGMWALSIYDKVAQKIITCRDRIGIKPCYYIEKVGLFACASEMKQLYQFSELNLDDEFNRNYFLTGNNSYDFHTWWTDIRELKPAHLAIYDIRSEKLEIKKYYTIPSIRKDVTIDDVRETLSSAIRLRLRSDVPVGITLSGGLDSSILATALGENDQAFTSSFSGWKMDETPYAQATADFNNLSLHSLETSWEAFVNEVGQTSYIHDGPINSFAAFSSFKLYELISESGIKVILNGQGADELFAGYEGYHMRYIKHLLGTRPLKAIKEGAILALSGRYKKKSINHYLKSSPSYSWMKGEIESHSLRSYSDFSFLSQLGLKALYSQSIPSILTSVDRNSMAHGVESRVPFLDHRVIELALNLEDDLKIKNGHRKHILRTIYGSQISPKILNRKTKQGYSSPQDKYLEMHWDFVLDRVKSLSELLPEFIHQQNLFLQLKISRDYKLLFRIWVWLEWRQDLLNRDW